MPKTACLLAVLLLAAAPAPAQRVLFVDADATGAGDGTTWADAFPRLQDALAAARPGDELWVAEGVYRPDRGAGIAPGDRTAYFDLRSGIALYGGFGGTETRRDERDWTAHETILSGDLAGDDGDVLDPFDPTRADNAFHVVGAGDAARGPASATAILDGFTVTGGNANALGIDPNNTGGGFCIILESRPTLRHLVVTRNTARFGGGMGLVSLAAPALEDVVFRENAASEKGGGAWSFVSRPTMRGVRFERNRSDGRGGGLFNEGSAALIDDAVFIGNAAGLDGGGIASERDNSVLTNARVLGNTAPRWGGGMFNVRSAPILMNVVFSGNASTEAGTGD
ncbi:MAG: hypothetical protein R3247_09940, partial [Rhodothermales bacterium]|nr:hypothetical protein [Rhodothermales bacterium]